MYNSRKITEDLFWIGANNRRLALFENVYPIPFGVSYNSYLLKDEKTILFDTIDKSEAEQFLENLKFALDGRTLDYIVVQHMEPDHCATLTRVAELYPNAKIICNAKTVKMIKQFFEFDIDSKSIIVKSGDTISTGKHNLAFVEAPMVHWPEVMVTYDTTDKILFSADAFGTFGAVDGNIFADEVDFEADYLSEARRYYTNIVGKYGTQVKSILKKASKLDIKMICPLHGFIWRKNINLIFEKYVKWATYEPEEKSVMIVYASVYGSTKNAAEILATKLADKGLKNIKLFDVSVTHFSYLIAEAFRYSHIVFASTTYNAEIFVNMAHFINTFVAHKIENRTVAFIENGTWASTSAKLMAKELKEIPSTTILDKTVSIVSSLKENQISDIECLAHTIYSSIFENDKNRDIDNSKIENHALFNFEYGLSILSTKYENKQNACVINTAIQVTDNPKRILIAVNKNNYTHDLILKSKKFNLSLLNTDTTFSLIKQFGFSSGREVNKFAALKDLGKSSNDIYYITEATNAYISGDVIQTVDCATHTIFIADVVEAKVLSDIPSLTYNYYFKHIKPNPNSALEEKKKGYVCKICGFVYEGDELPPDYICPLCKHGIDAFEKIQ